MLCIFPLSGSKFDLVNKKENVYSESSFLNFLYTIPNSDSEGKSLQKRPKNETTECTSLHANIEGMREVYFLLKNHSPPLYYTDF